MNNQNLYTLESLLVHNESYNREHRLTKNDVDMANEYVRLIEITRSKFIPKAGDMVHYTTRYGDFYPHSHIDCAEDRGYSICEQPYVPFIRADKKRKGIVCSTSGGAWALIPKDKLTYIGKENKCFCDWGHCGACGNGAVRFEARVSLWEYTQADPIFGPFTTKDWRKMYISKLITPEARNNHGGYMYLGDGIAFQTEQEFMEFVALYHGTLIQTNATESCNSYVLWCYRHQDKVLSAEEWDKIACPSNSRYFFGREKLVKTVVDDAKHLVTAYLSRQQYCADN